MGRTPRSMRRLGRALERHGLNVERFGYSARRETVDQIVARLIPVVARVSTHPSIVIGHSLGGLLLRVAVDRLPSDSSRPIHLIFLGTPSQVPRVARRFQRWWWYRKLNGDAGQMLADPARMASLPPPSVGIPWTIVAGTAGLRGRWTWFGNELNDGLVAVSETRLDGVGDVVPIHAWHPFLMSHPDALEAVLRVVQGPAR